MKQRYFKGLFISLLFICQVVQSGFLVKEIKSNNLSQEKVIFEKFLERFCGICLQQPIAQDVIREAFGYEERAYQEAQPTSLFFHALVENQVVGYISCDVLPNYNISIRQLAVDPDMLDAVLIKELLFAIFSAAPKTKKVSLCCPVACFELIALFQDLGFVQKDHEKPQNIQLYKIYELHVHPKCKICQVLYPGLWEDDEEPEELDESVEGLDILQVDRNLEVFNGQSV